MPDIIDIAAKQAERGMAGGVDLSRGVDLRAVANKRSHQHQWYLIAHFGVPEKVVAKMTEFKLADINARKKAVVERGEDDPGPQRVPLPMNLNEDALLGLDGPGCAKCGAHWESPGGFGELCKISDEEFKRAESEAMERAQAEGARVVEEVQTEATEGEDVS